MTKVLQRWQLTKHIPLFLLNLAKKLEPEYGSGFSVRQLERSRQFYKMYPIANALRSQFNWTQIETVRRLAENPNGECVGEIL